MLFCWRDCDAGKKNQERRIFRVTCQITQNIWTCGHRASTGATQATTSKALRWQAQQGEPCMSQNQRKFFTEGPTEHQRNNSSLWLASWGLAQNILFSHTHC